MLPWTTKCGGAAHAAVVQTCSFDLSSLTWSRVPMDASSDTSELSECCAVRLPHGANGSFSMSGVSHFVAWVQLERTTQRMR
jgi:hypothetical protein